jgi:antibiotic biosynthesis monooxygenase (ABM) superfamily enzyme
MWVRCGMFVGSVKPENQAKFNAFIDTRVRDKIATFPGLRRLRILRAKWREDGAPDIYQTIEMTFEDAAAIDAMLASPERAENVTLMKEIMPLFEGKVYHVNYEVSAEG